MARTLSRRAFLRASIGATTLVAGSGAYAFGIEPAVLLRVTSYQPSPSQWPQGFRLKIAALADIHVAEPYMSLARVEEIVRATNALGPDLIVLLGDYANSHRLITKAVPLPDFAAVAATLRAPLGVFAILGNHDWREDDAAQRANRGPAEARRALEARGITVLENTGRQPVKDGRPFWLLGLGDQWAWWGGASGGCTAGAWTTCGDARRGGGRRPGHPDGARARRVPRGPGPRRAHADRAHPRRAGAAVRLVAAHRLQIGNRYAYGHVVEEDRHLIVSGGLGCSIAPIRFGVPPEIVLVELGQAGAG